MTVSVSCSRCGGKVVPPDLSSSDWRCADCGPVLPLHLPAHIGRDIVESVSAHVDGRVPLWCPWPLPRGWLVTGLGWAGDERAGVCATVVACSGPSPFREGPADIVLIAEEPGIGLGNRFAGVAGLDPGVLFGQIGSLLPHARVTASGRETPMWAVDTPDDRVAYVGEARGMWLYAVAWPADAGYVFCEDIVLRDLTEWVPSELVYGAPSPYLHGGAGNGIIPQ